MLPDLDEIDQKILEELRRNAKVAGTELAKTVGLSNTACRARISKLERNGSIRGYTILSSDLLDENTVIAYIAIATDPKKPSVFKEFADFLKSIPEVVECMKVAGKYDFLIKLVCSNQRNYVQVRERIEGHDKCGEPLTFSGVVSIK